MSTIWRWRWRRTAIGRWLDSTIRLSVDLSICVSICRWGISAHVCAVVNTGSYRLIESTCGMHIKIGTKTLYGRHKTKPVKFARHRETGRERWREREVLSERGRQLKSSIKMGNKKHKKAKKKRAHATLQKSNQARRTTLNASAIGSTHCTYVYVLYVCARLQAVDTVKSAHK